MRLYYSIFNLYKVGATKLVTMNMQCQISYYYYCVQLKGLNDLKKNSMKS